MEDQIFILRTTKEKGETTGFCQVDNYVFQNKIISLKAKGILGFMLSMPPDWRPFRDNIIELGLDGRKAVISGLKELRENGFATLELVQEVDGAGNKIGSPKSQYFFSEFPNPDWLLKHSKQKTVKAKEKLRKSTMMNVDDFDKLYTFYIKDKSGQVTEIQTAQNYMIWAKLKFCEHYKSNFNADFHFDKTHINRLENLLKVIYTSTYNWIIENKKTKQHQYFKQSFDNLLTAADQHINKAEYYTPALILHKLHLLRTPSKEES